MTCPSDIRIAEWHTSELTAKCLRQVALKHQGKYKPVVYGAMYRGLLFGAACEQVHLQGLWSDVDKAMEIAVEYTHDSLKDEGRYMSEAVERDQDKLQTLVGLHVQWYSDRFCEFFNNDKVTLIGCEVPIRWTLEIDGEDVEFASHLDLIFKGPSVSNWDSAEDIWVWDWKFRDESPSPHYLARNMQLAMYALAVQYGSVEIEGFWTEIERLPRLAWIHAQYLAPFGRATKGFDDDGYPCEYKKGDVRPLHSVVRELDVSDEAAVLDEFTTRVRMARAGLWPTNPDPQGCRFCDSNYACPAFDYHGAPND